MDLIDQYIGANGVRTRTFTDELTGKMIVRKDQDIEAQVAYTTKLRNADQYSSDGIKKGMMQVCHIPDVVIVELMGIGVNVFKADAKTIVAGLKKLHKEHLLTTNKRV